MDIFNNNVLEINPNKYLLDFNKYNLEYNLEGVEKYIKIPNEIQIKRLENIKIPGGKNNFTSFKFKNDFDKKIVNFNLELEMTDTLLLTYKDIKFSLIYLNQNMYLIIYIGEEIKYKFLIIFYTIEEIYCINVTPSKNMMGLLNNIKKENKEKINV